MKFTYNTKLEVILREKGKQKENSTTSLNITTTKFPVLLNLHAILQWLSWHNRNFENHKPQQKNSCILPEQCTNTSPENFVSMNIQLFYVLLSTTNNTRFQIYARCNKCKLYSLEIERFTRPCLI